MKKGGIETNWICFSVDSVVLLYSWILLVFVSTYGLQDFVIYAEI